MSRPDVRVFGQKWRDGIDSALLVFDNQVGVLWITSGNRVEGVAQIDNEFA